MNIKKKISTEYVEKNMSLRKSQLERKKQVYKDINSYIISLKMSLNTASEKDRKVIKKNIKKLAKTQRQFEV